MYQNDIGEAVQIVRLLIEGLIFIIKVPAGMTTRGIKLLGKALWHAYTKDNKEIGKTNMKQMVARGGDIQLFQFDASERKLVEKMAKQYGILYAIMPDLNKADGKMEIIFHAEATPRMNALINKLNDARIISHQNYLDNAQAEEVADLEQEYHDFMEDVFREMRAEPGGEGFWKTAEEKKDVLQFLESDMKTVKEHAEKLGIVYETIPNFLKEGNTGMLINADSVAKVDELLLALKAVGVEGKDHITTSKVEEKVVEYKQISNQINRAAYERSDRYIELSINEVLIHGEDENSYFTRVPNTAGEDYVAFDKDKCFWNDAENTFITYIEADKEIQIYSKHGLKTNVISGDKLFKKYDKVGDERLNKQFGKENIAKHADINKKRVAEGGKKSPQPKARVAERSVKK